jgi:hypothetical protein
VKWIHEKAVSLEVELMSRDANLMSVPMPISIGLKNDAPPRVNISYTGVRQRITPQAHVPLTLLARDDFGVTKIDLTTKVDFPDPSTQGPAAQQHEKSHASTQPSELEIPSRISSTSSDEDRHRLAAFAHRLGDRCMLSRAADRLIAHVTFRIVAPEELFREILLRQQGERAKFRKAIEDATSHPRSAFHARFR